MYPPPTYTYVSDECNVCIKIFKARIAINLDCTGVGLRNLKAYFSHLSLHNTMTAFI